MSHQTAARQNNRQLVERFGRKLLIFILGHLFRVRPKAVVLSSDTPKILVIRLDRRLGNVLLSTPVLNSLRARFPKATIDILVDARGTQVLQAHPAINTVWAYNKSALCHAYGPVRTLMRLRRQRYDVCIDLGNPTDASTTQIIITRFANARHTIGSQQPNFSSLLTCSVPIPSTVTHEIDKRLCLLQALPGEARCRTLSLGPLTLPQSSRIPTFVNSVCQGPYAVLNLGARLANKQLDAVLYARIANCIHHFGFATILTWGPSESRLAAQVAEHASDAQIAPPSNISELAYLMRHAQFVISCDTGPMHLAVALQRPTCAIFVSTPAARFGYTKEPHQSITADLKNPEALLLAIEGFVQQQASLRRLANNAGDARQHP